MTVPVKVAGPTLRKGVSPYAESCFLPVANGTHFNGNGGSTQTSLITGTRVRATRKLLRVIAPGGTDVLQIEWANTWTTVIPQSGDATCEISNANAVKCRMAIEYPAGQPRQISGSTTYSAATAYAINDQVVYSSLKYVCIAAGTGQTPSTSPLYWRLVRTYAVTWDGQSSSDGTVTFAAGEYKRSRPVQLLEKVRAGDKIAVLGAFDSGSSGNYIPYAGANGACNTAPFVDWVIDYATDIASTTTIVENGVTTETNGNTTTANSTTASAWMKIPYATAITGIIPVKRCIALFGDSLIQGSGGDIRDGEPAGIFVRSLDGVNWWRIAQGGNRAGCYVPGNAPWQASVLSRCTAVLTNMAMNDINANLTFAQTQSAMQQMWNFLKQAGIPAWGGYLTPISASSDSWATTTNQTRWTNSGAVNTTQNPNDDATYLTSIYGLTAMWLSQDGASMFAGDATVKVGQVGHPLEGLLDWRGLMADPATSWKWSAGYTSDGAHPTSVAAVVQAAYLAAQMEPLVMGRQIAPQVPPFFSPHGEPPIQSLPRSLVSDNSSSEAAAGTFVSVVAVSPGRFYYGFRIAAGSATAASRNWTVLSGADPAKLKVIQSGSFTPVASAVQDTAFTGTPVWIPAGQVIAVALTVPITTANVYLGSNAVFANMNKQALGFVTAGKSTDTSALTGTKSIFNATSGAGAFAPHVFRLWVEVY